jgi:hypothetical protein
MKRGAWALVTSKIRMPSKPLVALPGPLLHCSVACRLSIERNSSRWRPVSQTPTSFCGPGQEKSLRHAD